jgi:hypothetical protein
MSKNKKHLLKLADKLKKIYFKNSIKIVSKNINLNFNYERPLEGSVEEIKKKTKEGKNHSLKFYSKYNLPILSRELISKDIQNKDKTYLKNIKLVESKNKSLDYEKLPPTNQNNNLKYYKKTAGESSKLETKKIRNNNNYYILPQKLLSTGEKYNLNNKMIKSNRNDKLINSNLMDKKTTTKLKIKYIENPKDFKKISESTIANPTSEIDLKSIVAPSKQQLINIKNQLKAEKKTNKERIVKVKKPIMLNKGNSIPKLALDKVVYAIPGYEEGTNGPLKNDVIAKLHKNETVLNSGDTRRLFQSNKLMTKKNVPNLKYMEKEYENQKIALDETAKLQINPKNLKAKSVLEDIDERSKQINLTQNTLRDSIDFLTFDFGFDRIASNLNDPLLHNEILKKDKMPPNWRASLG